jgi:hypothetical protein
MKKKLFGVVAVLTMFTGVTAVPTPARAASYHAWASLTNCTFDNPLWGSSPYDAAYWASFGSANRSFKSVNPGQGDAHLIYFSFNGGSNTSTSKWWGINQHGNTIYANVRTPNC